MSEHSLFIDFCPSEQVNQKNPDKHSTIVIAGCIYQADKATEQEICRILEQKSRSHAKLKAIPKIQGMIEKGNLKIQSFCLAHSKDIMYKEGGINLMDSVQQRSVHNLGEKHLSAIIDSATEKRANELGISRSQAVSAMAIQILAFLIASYFLKAHKTLLGNELNIILDRIPFHVRNIESFYQVYKHCFTHIRKSIEKDVGKRITLYPLHGNGNISDPCGIKLADFLANCSAREITLVAWNKHGHGISYPREPGMPKHNPKSHEFLDWMFKEGHLLHLTPTMLQRLLRGGNFEGDLEKIQKMQKEHGCEWWRVVPPKMRTLITLGDDERKKLFQAINLAIYSGEELPDGIENLVPTIGKK